MKTNILLEKNNVTTDDLVAAINDILKEGFILKKIINFPYSRTEPHHIVNTFIFVKDATAKHIWYDERQCQ